MQCFLAIITDMFIKGHRGRDNTVSLFTLSASESKYHGEIVISLFKGTKE